MFVYVLSNDVYLCLMKLYRNRMQDFLIVENKEILQEENVIVEAPIGGIRHSHYGLENIRT